MQFQASVPLPSLPSHICSIKASLQEQCDEQYLDPRNAHKRGPRYQRNRMAIDRDGLEEGKERGKERASEVPIFSALTVRRTNTTTTTAIKTTICPIASEPIGSASAAVARCSTSLTRSPVSSLAHSQTDRRPRSLTCAKFISWRPFRKGDRCQFRADGGAAVGGRTGEVAECPRGGAAGRGLDFLAHTWSQTEMSLTHRTRRLTAHPSEATFLLN